MRSVKIRLILLGAMLATGALLVAVSLPANRETSGPVNQTQFAQTLQWADLLPDQQARADDSTPRADLDGKRVAIAGYMTPFVVSEGETRAFLLVPYVGACIHVPAPPPNQIVLVETAEPVPVRSMYEPFTAIGTLHVKLVDTGLAPVGYTMTLDHIGPYTAESAPLEGIRSANDGD